MSGRQLVIKAQAETQLDPDFALVAEVSGQFVLTAAAQEFYERVTWDADIATQWRPDERDGSPVVVDPESASGRPQSAGSAPRSCGNRHSRVRTKPIWLRRSG